MCFLPHVLLDFCTFYCTDNMEAAAGVNSNGRDRDSRSRGRKKSNSGGGGGSGGLYKNYQKSMAASDVRENGSRSRWGNVCYYRVVHQVVHYTFC